MQNPAPGAHWDDTEQLVVEDDEGSSTEYDAIAIENPGVVDDIRSQMWMSKPPLLLAQLTATAVQSRVSVGLRCMVVRQSNDTYKT